MFGNERLGKDVEKRQLAFADDDRIALIQRFLLSRRTVYKNMVHTSFQRTILIVTIDDPKPLAIRDDVRVLTGHAPVIENDAVLVRTSDRVIFPRLQRKFALSSAGLHDP